jgi:hypothetical protein
MFEENLSNIEALRIAGKFLCFPAFYYVQIKGYLVRPTLLTIRRAAQPQKLVKW